jgi:hypothetical protein
MTGSCDVNRAIDYVLEEFDECVADAERSHGGTEFSVGLYPPKGFLDPVHVDKLRELGFEVKAVYTATDTTRRTIVDFRPVDTDD